MKPRIIVLLSATLFFAVGAFCQSDNDGCTNATLHGDYAFTISGQIAPPNGPTRLGVAMTHFDGNGNLTQKDFVVSNGVPLNGIGQTAFNSETGSYNINSDCTGTAQILFPGPPGSNASVTITLNLVLANHGRTIHTVVSQISGPGGLVAAAIHSDAERLGGDGN